jgi:phosphatidylserine decarboxylase
LLLIGALNVGSMETVWHGEVAPRRIREVTDLDLGSAGAPYCAVRGEEMGRFNMGSTVILLFPPDTVEWQANMVPGKTLRMGESIGRLLRQTPA